VHIYFGEQYYRRQAIGKTIEIEVRSDGQRVKRRGVLTRAVGLTFWIGQTVYHVSEVLSVHEVLP